MMTPEWLAGIGSTMARSAHSRLLPIASRRSTLVGPTSVDHRILEVRGTRVMLDHDLAMLYGVTTGVLNQAVTRNAARFPADFMFRLSADETRNLKSQIVISSAGHGGRRKRPRAFTEQGVAMLSGVLRSARAIRVNITIMRAFARFRGVLATQAALVQRIDALEHRYDGHFANVFDAIRRIVQGPRIPARRRIGFTA